MTIALELKQLKKTYPGGVQALRGIDLQVEAGDFYALLGPNGAGKSTVFRLIAGEEHPAGGVISFSGALHERAGRLVGRHPRQHIHP